MQRLGDRSPSHFDVDKCLDCISGDINRQLTYSHSIAERLIGIQGFQFIQRSSDEELDLILARAPDGGEWRPGGSLDLGWRRYWPSIDETPRLRWLAFHAFCALLLLLHRQKNG